MADLDDALVNYLTDKYSADAENGENDAEMDDIPDRQAQRLSKSTGFTYNSVLLLVEDLKDLLMSQTVSLKPLKIPTRQLIQ